MKKETIIAPLIITILFILYYSVMLWVIFFLVDNLLLKFILGLIPIILMAIFLHTFYERYQEIRKDENNDISKY